MDDGDAVDDSGRIRAIRRHEAGAFEALFKAYRDRVFRYACALTGNVSVAEDLLQDAFLGLLGNVNRLDESRPLLPYLLRSVRHRHIDRLRSFAERGKPLPHADDLVTEEEPLDATLQEERIALVQRALDQLPEEQAEVIRLRIYGGLTYEQIAAESTKPRDTIRNRYRAGLEKLRSLLGRSVGDV